MRRGGGSRGHSSSHSSRMSSSSRRHYSRRSYNNRSYYRRGYYGGYGRYGRQNNPIAGLIILGIGALIFVPLFFSAFFATNSIYNFTLEAKSTKKIDYDGFLYSDVEFSVPRGQAQLLTFNSEPPLSGNAPSSYKFPNENLPSVEVEYFELHLTVGSTVKVSYAASGSLTIYFIEGHSNFNKWYNAGDNSAALTYNRGSTFSTTYSAGKSDTYYIGLENSGLNDISYSINLDINMKVHDVSNPVNSFFPGTIKGSNLDGKTLIVYNPSDTDADVIVVVKAKLNIVFVYWTTFIVIGSIFFFLIKSAWKSQAKKKRARDEEMGIQSSQIGTYTDTSQLPTFSDQPSSGQFWKPNNSGYYQRPAPKYCSNCGSSVLPSSKFCSECGTKI